MARLFLFVLALTGTVALDRGARERLERDLSELVAIAAASGNSSVSVAIDHPTFQVSAADGLTNRQSEQRAHPSDLYALGSVTKTMTGAAVMLLAAQGKLDLDDRAHRYIDPMFRRERYAYPTLQELFSRSRWSGGGSGPQFNASDITIRDLLHMQSGVPDYDTEGYRRLQWSLPKVDFSPLQIFDYVSGPLQFQPGHPPYDFTYCSVNFILLGYVLSYFQNTSSWEELNQRSILPPGLQQSTQIKFAIEGPCSRYTHVHGYDTRSRVAAAAGTTVDWSDASCLAGWTGGNVLMSAPAAANWTAALYRPTGSVLPPGSSRAMYPGQGEFYGLATFNLTGYNGMSGSKATAWGHLGDTYGFTSIAAYFPAMDFGLAVLTNQEGSQQDSVLALLCKTYNMVQDALEDVPYRNCTYSRGDYYRGVCKCKPAGSI